MKRLISVAILIMSFCASFAQISEFLHPPKEAFPRESGLSEDVNPLWWEAIGKAYSEYAARWEVMKMGESDSDISALALADGLQCIHRKAGDRDIYTVVNPTMESLKVVASKDRRKRNANIYILRDGAVRGMIPNPDSRGTYREVIVGPKETIYVVYEKYKAPRMKVHDGVTVFREIKDAERIASQSGYVNYSAKINVPEKQLRRERNIGNRFILDLGDTKDAAVIICVNGKANADTLWHAPFSADITDRLVGGENELEVTVINPLNDVEEDAAPWQPGSIILKLLRQKQILETRP